MSTVHHPAFPNLTREVEDAARWVRSGWVADDAPVKSEKPKAKPRRRKPAKG